MMTRLLTPRQAWAAEPAEQSFFPLRVVGKNKAGRERFRVEVTATQRQSFADSLFTPPEDFERLALGGRMRDRMKEALKDALPFGR